MLMAHSVEGRFPFLDKDVVALANSLPAAYKLRVLDEKHVLKRARERPRPAEIIARKKQPYRAPDALSFVGRAAPDYVDEVLAANAASRRPASSSRRRSRSCGRSARRARDADQFSNTDNMALVGVLSTQLLHHRYIASQPTDLIKQ